MLQGRYLNSRYTRDMKNNMEARTYAHTHIVLAKVQYEENRPAHLVLHTRDKQLKSAPHAGHQSMCCHICSGSTVSKGPEDRPKKISHWPQCHSVDTRLFCCRCATSASKNVVHIFRETFKLVPRPNHNHVLNLLISAAQLLCDFSKCNSFSRV